MVEQTRLFDAQIQKRGSVEAAAKISAPPGYSEHHTGYAVDLTDGRYPKRDITYEFVQTDAFQWLTRRAQEFGFELSFRDRNAQGVSYEPWHWRFVGSPQAAAIFQHESVQRVGEADSVENWVGGKIYIMYLRNICAPRLGSHHD